MRLICVITTILLISVVMGRCSDSSSCFVKKLFDFSYPEEGVYKINLDNGHNPLNYQILGYGDFNNDLRADFVALTTTGLELYYYSA